MDNQVDRQLLLQLAGELRATRYVLSTLIATLPDVRPLAETLARQMPDIGDEIIGGSPPTSEPEREGWMRVLASTTRLLDEIHRRRPEG